MKKIFPLLFLIILFRDANADIIVTSAEHTLGGGDYVYLDVNNDGINDYLLSIAYGPVTIQGFNGCQVETGVNGTAIGLNTGAPVGTNSWQDSATIYFSSGTYYFPLNTFASLGLKLVKGGQTYYGYLEMEVNGTSTVFTVSTFNMGYDNVPGEIIDAGAAATGIAEVIPDNIKWNVVNETLKVVLPGNTGSELQIYSYDGKMLLRKWIGAETGEVSLDALSAGIYLFAINNTKSQYSRSFFKP